jgi:signal transduction histidine kinase
MRRWLAGVSLAVTLMMALAFLLPLGVLVRTEARDQHTAAAEQRASALAPILALTDDPGELTGAISDLDSSGTLGVRLPNGRQLGTRHAPQALLARAADERESITQDLPGGWIDLQPVVLPGNRVAVIEEFVPAGELTNGVAASWGVMALLALGLIAGSMLVADRLGAQVVTSSRQLSHAARALGAGDLATRVEPHGPPELRSVGRAFNAMANRMVELLAIERELVADLSHRLRTPLTALSLAAERMGPTLDAQRVTSAVDQLESELQSIITAARTPLATGPMGRALQSPTDSQGVAFPGSVAGAKPPLAEPIEAAVVIGRRAGFWSTLAAQEDRLCQVSISTEPTPVDLPEDDLAAMVDALVGNVFRHTPRGTAFALRVDRTAGAVVLVVEDAGAGIVDGEQALARGASSSSTGLGLDIALRAASATRGELTISRSRMGGACLTVQLGLATSPSMGGRFSGHRRTRGGCGCGRGRGLRARKK